MCRKLKGQILIKVHCTCSSVWPLPNRLQCPHLTLIPLTCDYQWPHGERCSKNTWPSILAASSPNMNLSANMASEAISEHLILHWGSMAPDPPSMCMLAYIPSSVSPQFQVPSAASVSYLPETLCQMNITFQDFSWVLLFSSKIFLYPRPFHCVMQSHICIYTTSHLHTPNP